MTTTAHHNIYMNHLCIRSSSGNLNLLLAAGALCFCDGLLLSPPASTQMDGSGGRGQRRYTCRYCPDIRPGPLTPTAGVIPGIKIASSLLAALPALKSSTFAKLQTDATQVPANNLPRPISKGRFQNMRESLEGVLFQR